MALSDQVMFNRVAKHLVKQGCRAMLDNGNCAYLAQDGSGRKCAIGIFIPDGHAAQHADLPVAELIQEYPDLCDLIGSDVDFLEGLQSLHDDQDN